MDFESRNLETMLTELENFRILGTLEFWGRP